MLMVPTTSARSNEHSQDSHQLSRSHALKIADYIIPGHGKMFKVGNTT